MVRYSILAANVLLLAVVAVFVTSNSGKGAVTNSSAVLASNPDKATNALDQLSSADIAVHVAVLTNLAEATSVRNNADTVNAQLAVTPADDTVVAKPQIVATDLRSRKDIQSYTVKDGDTVTTVAAKFKVTSDSVRGSNGLSGDALQVGKVIFIPPVDGLVYIVKAGDTPDSLASKFKANKDQIVADNDAETSGLKVGEKVLIRDGVLAAATTTRVAATGGGYSGFAWGGAAIYGSNGYDYGYCTWWAAKRRADIGRPIPSNLGNASTWKALAARAGIPTGSVPQAGAVIWTPPRDYYGHVGFVESMNADGSANISEMNTIGWGRVAYKTISAEEASHYGYIY